MAHYEPLHPPTEINEVSAKCQESVQAEGIDKFLENIIVIFVSI